MLEGNIISMGETEGGITAHVEVVDIEGKNYVLKTDTKFDVVGEVLFQQYLEQLNLPFIRTFEHSDLQDNQMLMELVKAETMAGPNFNPENLRALGKVLKSVHLKIFDSFMYLDETGSLQNGHWEVFIETMAKYAMKTAARDNGEAQAVEASTAKLKAAKPEAFVLCHGDVHGNNAFVSEGKIILFDNNADSIVATPGYDLATLFGENLMGYRYGSEFSQREGLDRPRMEAFLDGYGELPDDFEETIDDYVFLRLLARHPNQFIKHQDKLIAHLARNTY